MSEFLKTPKTKTLLLVLCGVLVALIAFGLGIAVGYRRAIFASEFGENYYRGLHGDSWRRPMAGMMGLGPLTMHGVAGIVLDVSGNTISVKDFRGNEQAVIVASGTPIRDMDEDVSVGVLAPDDRIIVIGEPNSNGQIVARFVRIFGTSSTLP